MTILFILFVILKYMPGSPFNDTSLSEEQTTLLNEKYGLNKPVYAQFGNYVKRMFAGDFGVSYVISKNTPVTVLLRARFPVTIRIGLQAVILGTALGVLLGVAAALKHNTIWDTLATVVSVLGVSLPSYVFALLLSYIFGYKLKWFPILYSSSRPFVSSILPTISLCMFTIAIVARFARSELIEVLDADYMLLAESKGISGSQLFFKHMLRNALIPIVTVLAPLVVGLMTGSLVIEKIFSIPGMGSLLVTAIQSNDYNVILALAFIYSVIYIGIMLIVDISYGIIDPKIRLAKGNERE